MSIMDYCEYNALKAWRKRAPTASLKRAWVDPSNAVPSVTLVQEHDPEGTTGIRVREIHEAILKARES